jgi:hypothetical protein
MVTFYLMRGVARHRIQLALHAQLPREHGGAGGETIYIGVCLSHCGSVGQGGAGM